MKIDRCYVAYEYESNVAFANELNTMWGAVQCGAIKRNMREREREKVKNQRK